MAIHIHLPSKKKVADHKVKNAGFSKQEYSPREFNRLQGEIDEVKVQIKEIKRPSYRKDDLERILAKLKAEQGKYRTDDSAGAVAKVEREIAQTQKLLDMMEKNGKGEQAGPHLQKLKFLAEELEKAKFRSDDTKDARSKAAVQKEITEIESMMDKLDRKSSEYKLLEEHALELGREYRAAKDASPTEALEKQLDELQAQIEKLEDQGQAISSVMRSERTKLQQQIMAAKLNTELKG